MFGVATVADAEPQTRDGTPAVAQRDGTLLAGLFRRTFDGGRCGPDGCPKPEPDVPDDPPPVKVEPPQKVEPPAVDDSMPSWLYGVAVIVGAAFAIGIGFMIGGKR
jgi:hypothetical protein